MKKNILLMIAAAASVFSVTSVAEAHWPVLLNKTPASYRAYSTSVGLPWHGGYYHAAHGEPVALVVPPTAEFQSNYGWGASGTRVSPIYHQYTRPYPGAQNPQAYGSGFRHTPSMPSDTTEFGVYYIRGPW